jgi:hypothetical protein
VLFVPLYLGLRHFDLLRIPVEQEIAGLDASRWGAGLLGLGLGLVVLWCCADGPAGATTRARRRPSSSHAALDACL